MGKTIGTFFLLFDFIHHIFFPEAFYLKIQKKQIKIDSDIHTKTEVSLGRGLLHQISDS